MTEPNYAAAAYGAICSDLLNALAQEKARNLALEAHLREIMEQAADNVREETALD